MAIDPESAGYGIGGGGLLGLLAAYFGIRSQSDRIKALEETAVTSMQHHECQRANIQQFDDIKRWLETISSKLDRLTEK